MSTPVAVAPRRWALLSAAALLGFVLLAVVVVATRGSDRFDRAVALYVVPLRRGTLTAAARLVTDLGAVPVVLVVAALVAAALWWRSRSVVPPIVLSTGVLVTGGLVYLLKLAVARSRPPVGALLGHASLDYSFPSGHTADAGVLYALSAVLLAPVVGRAVRRLVLVLGVLLPAAVGLTRVYLGYHWATDVVAGWFLAMSVVAAAACLQAVLPDFQAGLRRRPSAVRDDRPGGGRPGHPQLEPAPAVGCVDDQDVAALQAGGGAGDRQAEAAAPEIS